PFRHDDPFERREARLSESGLRAAPGALRGASSAGAYHGGVRATWAEADCRGGCDVVGLLLACPRCLSEQMVTASREGVVARDHSRILVADSGVSEQSGAAGNCYGR